MLALAMKCLLALNTSLFDICLLNWLSVACINGTFMWMIGHRDDNANLDKGNPGNFKALLQFRVEADDEVLKQHFSSASACHLPLQDNTEWNNSTLWERKPLPDKTRDLAKQLLLLCWLTRLKIRHTKNSYPLFCGTWTTAMILWSNCWVRSCMRRYCWRSTCWMYHVLHH